MVVWDDEDRIWYRVRANPVVSLYIPKGMDGLDRIAGLKKYDMIEVTGVVKSDFRKQPWVEIQSIESLPPEYGAQK